jgi:hypothetical protein
MVRIQAGESPMEQFVHRKNLERFRSLLEKVTDVTFRDQIKRLIAEEEAKELPPETSRSFTDRRMQSE